MGRSTIVGVACAVAITFSVSAAQAEVPNQFIAKQYTESLGRAPDAGGWQYFKGRFASACDQANLKSVGLEFFRSTEYAALGYTNEEKLLTAFRAILSREPDAPGYSYWLGVLDGGYPFDAVVGHLFDGTEFASRVPVICAGGGYGFSANPIAIPIGAGGDFSGGTGEQLQALLNAKQPGETVYLAPRSVTTVTAPLVVPAGVTLATVGDPGRTRYARMGRIVRGSLFTSPAVWLEPGAKLVSVWVSGQRQTVGFSTDAANIFVRSGNGGQVLRSRTDSPAGWSTLFLHGSKEQQIPCSNVLVSGNLSTGYTSSHTGGGWSDGISSACEGTTITDNHIVDPSDVGIVVFRATPANQASQVYGNTIVSAGVSAYAALGFDPLFLAAQPTFNGASIYANQLWTGTQTHFDIGLTVGTRAWFHDDVRGSVDGVGATAQNNSTAGIATRMNTGIAVDGMLSATVTGNDFVRISDPVARCPDVEVGADFLEGHASGTIESAVQAEFHSCIGHP